MDASQQIILGIDPGSNITGYGLIRIEGKVEHHLAHGHIKTHGNDLGQKLWQIHDRLCDIITEYQPTECAIESVFVNKNIQSALKLGQARGAALTACAKFALATNEYAPREIKQAIVGTGSATKVQIQHMITMLLKLPQQPQPDASDALAIALTHAHTQKWKKLITEL
jgi:crossover junction endodeoxyribonuclease RuvC